jgi:transcriptional regulator with XRE-family HTH domain
VFVSDEHSPDELITSFRDVEDRYRIARAIIDRRVGEQIRALRQQRGLTQAELATAAGTTQATISIFEREYGRWSVETLWRLARALDVRVAISFETFGTLVEAVSADDDLRRPTFEDDPLIAGLGGRSSETSRISCHECTCDIVFVPGLEWGVCSYCTHDVRAHDCWCSVEECTRLAWRDGPPYRCGDHRDMRMRRPL